MAVKTFNPAGTSDNWSTASAWGGSVPADGDSFVIAAGKTCYMDADQSGMATGMVAGTINGTLRGPNGAGTGYLKMDGVAGHDITIASGGTLQHGTSKASPAAANSIFKISLGVAGEIYASGADRTIKLHPTLKTIRHVRLASDASSGAGAIVVDQTNAALQADGWSVGDYICIVRPASSGTPSSQLFTIQSWGGGSTINLSGTLAANTITGCYVVNHTSNIMILSARTSGGETVINCNFNSPWLEIGANLVNTVCVSNGTNCGGYGIGMIVNTYDRSEFYGSIHGMNSGLYYNRCLDIAGAYITMCNAGMAKQIRSLCDVKILGCSAATNSACADDYYPTAALSFGNPYGIGGQGNCLFCGTAKGCLCGFLNYDGILSQLADIGGTSTIDRNYNGDIDWSEGAATVGQGVCLQSTTKVYLYKSTIPSAGVKSCVALYNFGAAVNSPQYGQHWFYTQGGYTFPTTDAGFAALGYPSVERMVFEKDSALSFIDLPVELTAGQPFAITIDVQLGSGLYTFVESPSVVIVDPALPFEDVGSVLAAAATSVGSGIDPSSSSIQRLFIGYVPPVSPSFPYGAKRPALLRFKAIGGNSSGTGTDYMLFAYSQAQSVAADVQSLGGSSSALTQLIADAGNAISLADGFSGSEWAGETVEDALKGAWVQGLGRWKLIVGPPHYLDLYAPDGATVVKRFSIDSIDLPTERV